MSVTTKIPTTAAALAVLFAGPPAAAGIFYDGPVAVVRSNLEVELGRVAQNSETTVLCNRGTTIATVDVSFELPPRSKVVDGSARPGSLLLGPGEEAVVSITFSVPLFPGSMKATSIRSALFLDGGLPGNAVEEAAVAARLPPGVTQLATATLPPASVTNDGGRTVVH